MSLNSEPQIKKEEIKIPENSPKIGSEWRHFKSEGMQYKVLDIIFDADTDEWKVLYEPLYESEIKKFARSVTGWNQNVEKSEYNGPRFIKIKD